MQKLIQTLTAAILVLCACNPAPTTAEQTLAAAESSSGMLDSSGSLSALGLSSPTAPGKILQLEYPREASRNFASTFRIYFPSNAKRIRGVIVHQHYCGGNGLRMPNDLQWQALANKWSFALLGTFFDGDCNIWAYPEKGSLEVLNRALAQFGQDAGFAGLENAPWALWGHSGGANWTYFLTQQVPDRIIANVSRSGSEGILPASAYGVPQLLAVGQLEQGHPNFGGAYNEGLGAFSSERAKGALVSLSIDPKALHELGFGRRLGIAYLDAVIAQRLPNRVGQGLRPVQAARAWLGNTATLEIAAASQYGGDAKTAAWLPNETVARRWQEFARTGNVTDTSPPAAPSSLVASREAGGLRLKWYAQADLESGIQGFRIYRDGTLIATVGAPFQGIDFGDEPTPESPAMEYLDAQASGGAKYQVCTVNGFGLEGPRRAVRVR